ncbi:hypothetical protein [Pandoraea bronchicola]|uniref:Uncharacterized protein n=1 Tax=Pandoraea bronchicola TaxID=2508287 RepID=A0A5E5BW10_9BURK|nr:hypothetical protein [Pandoraea bronchicola]VVE89486.1 hypothetical protein PBR20603_03458 [Pandoraea bronchicola]
MSTVGIEDSRVRAIHVISAVTSPARRFKELGDKTEVSAATWRSFWNRDGAIPSGAMLEGLAREWPQYAFWLVTGITDWEAGHVAPPTVDSLPERELQESPATTAYFVHRLKATNPKPLSAATRAFVESLEGLRYFALEKEATDALGGPAALAKLRDELIEHGILQKTVDKPLKLESLWTDEPVADPVIERAIEALLHERQQRSEKQLESLQLQRAEELASRRTDRQ